jgi:hypothetical protein
LFWITNLRSPKDTPQLSSRSRPTSLSRPTSSDARPVAASPPLAPQLPGLVHFCTAAGRSLAPLPAQRSPLRFAAAHNVTPDFRRKPSANLYACQDQVSCI